MKTVIVTAIGSFSAAAVIRGLREAGCRIVGTDIYPREWIAVSTEVDVFQQLPRCDAGQPYLDALTELILREKADAVIPLTDVELDVLSAVREKLLPAELWCSPADAVRNARDKMKSRSAAERAGARTIPTWRLSEVLRGKSPEGTAAGAELSAGPELSAAPEQAVLSAVSLPLILKPADGRSSQGLYRVRTEEELRRALRDIRADGTEEKYLLQPLIAGNVITVDVVRQRDGSCTATAREEFLRTWNGAGLSVRVFRDSALEEVSGAVARELGILGCVNFEFIRGEDGTYWFMECNPRFSGGAGFSVAAGDDVVRRHLAVFAPSIPAPGPGNCAKDCRIARKYVEVITD